MLSTVHAFASQHALDQTARTAILATGDRIAIESASVLGTVRATETQGFANAMHRMIVDSGQEAHAVIACRGTSATPAIYFKVH